MNIIVSGISFRTAPVEIRERLSFNTEEQKKAIQSMQKLFNARECILLSTCNRTEAYVYYEGKGFENSALEDILCSIKGLKLYTMKKHFYTFEGAKAARHLFKVACGLDSMVLGEDQILGQVKAAYQNALDAGTCGSILNTLFRDAITGAKKVKTATDLSKNSISVGSLAVKHVADMLGGDLGKLSAMVIGTGKIGSIVLKNLQAAGIGKLYITNRTHGRMDDLSGDYPEACRIGYDRRYSVMDACDIVISSTACPHYTITKDMLEASLEETKERVFVDLALPRDMDEDIREIPGVRYLNIDNLKREMDENLDRRALEAVKAEKMIDGFVMDFEKSYEFRIALPVVKDMQKYTEELVSEAVEATLRKLKSASDEDRETVKISITSTVNEIMNKFIYGIKENGSKEDIREYFRYVKDILKENS